MAIINVKLPPEVPQQSLNKKNKKLYSDEHTARIKAALKEYPDGRYEKRREGKKSGEISHASITLQDILKEANPEELHGVIKINNKFYALSNAVGKGAFGKAKLAQDLDTGEWVVVKIQEAKQESKSKGVAPRRLRDAAKQRTGSQREVGAMEILAKAKMEIRVLEAIQQGTGVKEVISRQFERAGQQHIQYIVVMKYVYGDSGKEFISKLQQGKVSLSSIEKLTIAAYFMKTLCDLKNKGFYHCDVSPGNIKIDLETGEVKLLDYASASPIKKKLTASEEDNPPAENASPEGTRGYRSPEASVTPTEKSEIYAAGVLLAQLLEFATMDMRKDPPELVWRKQNEFKDAMLQQAYAYVKRMTTVPSHWEDEKEAQKAVAARPAMQEAEEYFADLLRFEQTPPLSQSQYAHFIQKTPAAHEQRHGKATPSPASPARKKH